MVRLLNKRYNLGVEKVIVHCELPTALTRGILKKVFSKFVLNRVVVFASPTRKDGWLFGKSEMFREIVVGVQVWSIA